MGSVLIKYVSTPLLAVDLLAQRVLGRVSLRHYLISLIPALLFGTGLFLLFARDPGFLTAAEQMRHWKFWTPSTALVELSKEMGFQIPSHFMSLVAMVACIGVVGFYLLRFLRTRTYQRFFGLVLAVIMTVLFVFVGHVWPWFINPGRYRSPS